MCLLVVIYENNFQGRFLNSKNDFAQASKQNKKSAMLTILIREHESGNVFSARLYKHTLMRYYKIHHIKGLVSYKVY